MATDCEFLYRAAFTPGAMETFMDDPDNMSNILHFTKHDMADLYDEVDPEKRPELRQDGNVVAITGAGRGVGRGVALMFAKARAQAIGICSRTLSGLEDVRKEILEISPDTLVHVQRVDVCCEEDVNSFFDRMKSTFGAVDVAVSNAGANSCFEPFVSTNTETWWNDFTVNVKGTYLVAKYFSLAVEGKTGTLINVSSCHALAAVPHQTAYCSSKLAAARILEILHLDSPNIRCFSIHPGAVDTELLHELERKMGLRLRWRWTDPLLTGAAALWLTTPRAEFLRGRWISVNWRMDELEARKEEIVDQNLLKFAFNAKLGV